MEALKLSKWVFVRKFLKGFIRFRMKNKYAKKKGMSTQESNLMLEFTLPSFPFCLLPPCFYSNEWKVKPTQQLNEVVIHFQTSARTKLQIEFLYTYRPEEPEKKNEHFELKKDCSLLNHSIATDTLVGTGTSGWLHMFSESLAGFEWFLGWYFF